MTRTADGFWQETSDWSALPGTPLISITMATFNHGRYLADAIEGVLRQETEHDFELLVGDDCSTDDTLATALRYQRARPDIVRVVAARRNMGGRANLRHLFELARGPLIALCEGDDYWQDPGKLQVQACYFLDDPSISMVHSDYDRRVGDRVKRAVYRSSGIRFERVRDAFDDLLCDYRLMTATTMYRASIIREYLQLDPGVRDFAFQDRPLALLASQRGPVGYVDRSLATWRYVPGSATNSKLSAHLRMMRDIADCHERMASMARRSPPGFDAWRMRQEMGVYGAAYLCGDLAAMDEAAHWLSLHGRPVSRHSLYRGLARLRFPLMWPRARHAFRRWRERLLEVAAEP